MSSPVDDCEILMQIPSHSLPLRTAKLASFASSEFGLFLSITGAIFALLIQVIVLVVSWCPWR